MVEYSHEGAVRELRRQGLHVEFNGPQGPEGHTWTITSGNRQYYVTAKHLLHLKAHDKLSLEGIEELDRILKQSHNPSRP